MTDDSLEGDTLHAYVRSYGTEEALLDELLKQEGAPLVDERRPILLQGELANPYRLQEMNMGPLPLLPVRLEDLQNVGRRAGPARRIPRCPPRHPRTYTGLVGGKPPRFGFQRAA